MPELSDCSPVEVWLTQSNLAIKGMVVFDDETMRRFEPESLVMRGAQREVTAHLQAQRYEPRGRWRIEAVGESSRLFAKAAA